jgi:hypothetical protein
MTSTIADPGNVDLGILFRNVETLGKEFRDHYLSAEAARLSQLDENWFEALRFLFHRIFYRGRSDDRSFEYLCFTLDRLEFHLLPGRDLDARFQKIVELDRQGHLDYQTITQFKKRHRTGNSITHPRFESEIASANPLVKLLITKDTVKIAPPELWNKDPYEKEIRLGNDKDLMLVMDVLHHICQPGCQNVYSHLMTLIKKEGPRAAYDKLMAIQEVGDKLAALTLRDLGTLQTDLIDRDFDLVFPVDTWVRQVAKLFGRVEKDGKAGDLKLKTFFIRECQDHGLNPLLFAAGMWYLGSHSLQIVITKFLGKHPIEQMRSDAASSIPDVS